MKASVALMLGISLIVVGGASYFLVQQPFTDCPAFMGLGVGAIPQDILERCMVSGIVQITGAAIFTAGAGLSVYGVITKYSS
ncbi:MAG: hypothetical protein ACREA3_00530 [Nitrosotalea sp.]